ncbi:SLAC1 anion channel family protein [Salibaculum sp.]|uniref:SLAC1 anion channel family protein n=1 Tax=Salibaculum sp. TaxID=2855480 RepID=UPI002B488DA4|nr:SLAC1 anion channel family protein [Salibaculum sp.]HKL70794.1 SLAC1 anion channel family protein [Salibaculum sp.]
MTNTIPQEARSQGLAHFPVTFFAVVMGLLGLTLALHAAAPVWAPAAVLSSGMLGLSLLALVVISAFYGLKALRHPGDVAAEWQHPVKLAFFPTITISLLLLSTALWPLLPGVARGIWLCGVIGQGALTLAVISGWISHRSFEVGHLTPAWFIPAVGNVIVPVAGVPMGYVEISWLFFSGGLMFWVVLLTLVMNRLIFHDPIPARLFPTMVILIAPPAVAFVAYVALAGGLDGLARGLIYTSYIFTALVVVQVPKLARLPFALSWWGLSFPLAALAIASFRFAALAGTLAHLVIGVAALTVLALVVLGLAARTGLAVARGEICRPE